MFSSIKAWLAAGFALVLSIVYGLFQRERAKNAELERDIQRENNELERARRRVENEADKKLTDLQKEREQREDAKLRQTCKITKPADIESILNRRGKK